MKANEPKRIERLTLDKGGEDKSASSGGPMGTRERIVRRAALELKDNMNVNLGHSLPALFSFHYFLPLPLSTVRFFFICRHWYAHTCQQLPQGRRYNHAPIGERTFGHGTLPQAGFLFKLAIFFIFLKNFLFLHFHSLGKRRC